MHNMQEAIQLAHHSPTNRLDNKVYLAPSINDFGNLQVPIYNERMADEIFSIKTARMLALLRFLCNSHEFYKCLLISYTAKVEEIYSKCMIKLGQANFAELQSSPLRRSSVDCHYLS